MLVRKYTYCCTVVEAIKSGTREQKRPFPCNDASLQHARRIWQSLVGWDGTAATYLTKYCLVTCCRSMVALAARRLSDHLGRLVTRQTIEPLSILLCYHDQLFFLHLQHVSAACLCAVLCCMYLPEFPSAEHKPSQRPAACSATTSLGLARRTPHFDRVESITTRSQLVQTLYY